MRKVFYLIFIVEVAFGLVSCQKQEVESTGRQITICASTESSLDTKTSLSGNDATGYQVLWSAGDEISAVDADERSYTLTLSDGIGKTSGVFTSSEIIPDGRYKLFYGTDGSLLPREQKYMGENIISNAPMFTSVSVSESEVPAAELRNLCGLLRLTLKGTDTICKIKLAADEDMSGMIHVNEDGTLSFVRNTYQDVSLDLGEGVELTPEGKTFYISLPQNSYSHVSITVTDIDGYDCTKTLKSGKTLDIARAMITPASFTVVFDKPLSWNSPVGTVGMLDGRECVVVDLGGNVGKMAIATKNVGASSPTAKGTEMTWQDAVNHQNLEEWGLGWRLPSKEEIEALRNFQSHKTANSFVLNIADGVDLEFPLNGVSKVSDYNGKSVIWGSDLRFDSSGHLPCAMVDGSSYFNSNLTKTRKACVRPVHRLPITRNTPVDAVGFIGGKEGVVYELNKVTGKTKVVIALTNAGANSVRYNYEDDKVRYNCYGTVTTYENISHFIHGGWYLPTAIEMEGLYRSVAKWGNNFNTNYIYKPGMKNEDTNKSLRPDDAYNLEFPCSGGVSFTVDDINHGSYWTSTEDSDGGVFLMFVYTHSGRGGVAVSSNSYSKDSKAAARFFHAMPE